MGIYKDDGLGIFKNMSTPEVEKRKKNLLIYLKTMDQCKTQFKTADFLS